VSRLAVLLAAAVAALATGGLAQAAPPAPGTPDLDAASDTGQFSTDNITADTTPTFTVNAGIAQAGETVELWTKAGTSAATLAGSGVVAATGLVSITTSALGSSDYVVTAYTDDGLELSTSSDALTITVDAIAPILAVAPTLVDSVGFSGTLTYTSTPRLSVSASTGATVTIYEATTARGSDVSVAGIATVFVSTALSEGSHTLTAKATDLAGNASASSPAITITVDTKAPTTTSVALYAADDDGASATDRVTTNPRPRLEVRTEAGARVTLYENGLALGSVVAGGTGVALVAPTDQQWLDPGVHCLTTVAVDAVGNAAPETAEVCLTVAEGVEPFTTNLGATLTETTVTVALRSSLAARASIRVLRGRRVVAKATRTLAADARTRITLRLPRGVKRITIVAVVRSADGRASTLRRVAVR
jgi:hypothetical protein